MRGPWPGSKKGIAVQYSILVSGFRGPFQSAIVFITYYSMLLCPDRETRRRDRPSHPQSDTFHTQRGSSINTVNSFNKVSVGQGIVNNRIGDSDVLWTRVPCPSTTRTAKHQLHPAAQDATARAVSAQEMSTMIHLVSAALIRFGCT